MTRKAMVILGFLAWLAAPWTMSRAWAGEMNPEDEKAIHAVVQSQLDAFAQDDADKAFGLASPSARKLMGSAENFMQIVKDKYPPVYRHRTVIFSAPETIEGRTFQLVCLTDDDDAVWIAVYTMKRDASGAWKIDGCRLLETDSVSI